MRAVASASTKVTRVARRVADHTSATVVASLVRAIAFAIGTRTLILAFMRQAVPVAAILTHFTLVTPIYAHIPQAILSETASAMRNFKLCITVGAIFAYQTYFCVLTAAYARHIRAVKHVTIRVNAKTARHVDATLVTRTIASIANPAANIFTIAVPTTRTFPQRTISPARTIPVMAIPATIKKAIGIAANKAFPATQRGGITAFLQCCGAIGALGAIICFRRMVWVSFCYCVSTRTN